MTPFSNSRFITNVSMSFAVASRLMKRFYGSTPFKVSSLENFNLCANAYPMTAFEMRCVSMKILHVFKSKTLRH